MATQKVPLTRIDPTGASEGKVLKYSSGALAWGDDNNSGGGGGGGDGTAFKNTILATESVSANSLEQYQVHSGLEILSGGSFTISLSGDLVLDAPDDPHKAAGWTDSGNVIHTTDSLNKVVIGQTTALSADDMLSVAGGNVTVAGSVSAQGDVYGNNIGKVLQVQQTVLKTNAVATTSDNWTNFGLSATITPKSTTSKILVSYHAHLAHYWVSPATRLARTIGSGSQENDLAIGTVGSWDPEGEGGATTWNSVYQGANYVMSLQSFEYLDSPNTTESITYQVQTLSWDGSSGGTVYVNRNAGSTYGTPPCSVITVKEIAG